jgi:hypothetical protein
VNNQQRTKEVDRRFQAERKRRKKAAKARNQPSLAGDALERLARIQASKATAPGCGVCANHDGGLLDQAD